MAGALDTAHDAGLVHRDVKPANILLTAIVGREEHEHVYLTDFGLTKGASALAKLTATGKFLGTLAYTSPEQIRGEPLDARTDLYALGCVAYECLTGAPPFVRDDQAALLWAHLNDPPRRCHCTSTTCCRRIRSLRRRSRRTPWIDTRAARISPSP